MSSMCVLSGQSIRAPAQRAELARHPVSVALHLQRALHSLQHLVQAVVLVRRQRQILLSVAQLLCKRLLLRKSLASPARASNTLWPMWCQTEPHLYLLPMSVRQLLPPPHPPSWLGMTYRAVHMGVS